MKPFRLLVVCAAVIAAALSTGCRSSSSAIVRTVIISHSPSTDCITNAVRKISGIDNVMPITVLSEPTWSIYHRYNRELPYQNYRYLGPGGTRGIVSVKPQSAHVVGLELSRTWSERKPTTAEVDAARRIMDEIYTNLFKECGNLPPPESVQENFVNLEEYEKRWRSETGNVKLAR